MNPADPAIRAVLFDVDGTLYRQGPLRRRMAVELLRYVCCSPVRGLRTVRVIRRFRAEMEGLRQHQDPGVFLGQFQQQATAREAGVPVTFVREVVEEWLLRQPLPHLRSCRRPGIVVLLEACMAQGVAVGAFSDYPTRDKVESLGLGGWFDLHLCGTDPEVNAFKPAPVGLEVACEHWGMEPAQVLYVGDRPEVDGAAARAAGTRFALVGNGRDDNGAAARDFRQLLHFLG